MIDWLRIGAGIVVMIAAAVLWWAFSGVEVRELTPEQRKELEDLDEQIKRVSELKKGLEDSDS